MSNQDRFEFTLTVDGKEKQLYFKRPDQGQMFECDLANKAAMTKLIKRGVMTTHVAAKQFQKSGEWNTQDEEALRNYTEVILRYESDLNKNKKDNSHETNMELYEKLKELRANQMALIMQKNDLFRHCAENLAEEQKIHAISKLCTYEQESDTPLFNDDAHYQNFLMDEHDASSILFDRTYAFEYNYRDNFGEDWAEEIYLKEYTDKQKEAESAEEPEEQDADEDTAIEVAPLEKKRKKKKKKRKRQRQRV